MCCSKEIAASFIADSTPLVIMRLIDLIDRPTPPGPAFGSGGGDHGEESQERYLRDSDCLKNVSAVVLFDGCIPQRLRCLKNVSTAVLLD